MVPVGAWSKTLQPQGGDYSVGAAVTQATHIQTLGSQKPGAGSRDIQAAAPRQSSALGQELSGGKERNQGKAPPGPVSPSPTPLLSLSLPFPLPPHLRWKTQKENEPGPRSGEPQPAGLE